MRVSMTPAILSILYPALLGNVITLLLSSISISMKSVSSVMTKVAIVLKSTTLKASASYGVLQYQIGKIWAVLGEEALDGVKNALNFISNGSDTIKTLSGWMQETRSQIDTVRRIANNARTGLDTLREAQNTLKEANDILGSVSDMHEDWLKGIDKSLKNHSQSIADYKKSIDFFP
ncbi:organellar and viral DNA polymerase type B [Trichomonas vaginalis G3]|uniref:organellar and viral DNA polymerase type B n=1 Tax=Trichomonas vaginalis (strain ATCC PRA-98 / G3) TaxID=412133 RepID=UPI0021E611DB|nr:organellar and viral DNA polymerase type B [Trichomonas vaginalis G3]KAI5502018.1 organellar and viral DNA polymerase type B [Trichomonas vaginalis G3]